MLITDSEKLKQYQKENRLWQGIPGIEKTAGGRLFVTFYSGGEGEGPGNYVLLKKSDDDGDIWSGIIAVCDPKAPYRAFDPCLWIDPYGRLWWFWSQSEGKFDGVCGVWFSRCDFPDENKLEWTAPMRFANGVMLNKPTVLKNGDWLMPCAVWTDGCYERMPEIEGLRSERKSNVYLSRDKGESFSLHGQADVPKRSFDEHMVLELKDGTLLMFVRAKYGIGKSYSKDGGATWTLGEDSGLEGPCSRFFIRRLSSGRILLINHHDFTGRNNLTAMLSEDECESWSGHLLLDGRDKVSYPDATEDIDGNIYVIYDRERHADKEILMAKITEKDIMAGRIVTEGSRLRVIADKL